MKAPFQEGFSTRVHLRLYVDGQKIGVAQVGPDIIRLRRPCLGIEGKEALLVIRIGRTRKRRQIILGRFVPEDPKEIRYW